ncbi:MAG: hypothetical protein ACKVWR_05370 [Acidimicrobiales bacterium]
MRAARLVLAIGLAAAGCTSNDPSGADAAAPPPRPASPAAPIAPVGPSAAAGPTSAPPPETETAPPGPPCDRTVTAGEAIQAAIDAAPSGPYVLCVSGEHRGGGLPADPGRRYWGNVVISGRDGFTLRGLPGAVLRGIPNDEVYPPESAPADEQHPNDKAILVKVVDSADVVIEGLTIDGLADGRPVLNRLVWLQGAVRASVRDNVIRNAGAECVRVKSDSTDNEIAWNEISRCGYYQFELQKEERLRKNGEAVYIGTDPVQITTTQVNKQRWWGLDAALGTDRSARNRAHHNRLAPGPPGAKWGNECVDVKEDWPVPRRDLPGDETRGAPGQNVIADNECSGQYDEESGAFDARSGANVFEHNRVFGEVRGAALRLGGGEKRLDGFGEVDWSAAGNRVRLNVLEAWGGSAPIKTFKGQPLAAGDGVCGNVDGRGDPAFGGRFTTTKDTGANLARCGDSAAPPGPRGAVGPRRR